MGRVFYPRCRAVLDLVLDGYDTGPGSQDEPIHVAVTPRSATIHVNSYRQADSWELTFDARDAPFDPQLIRSGMVQIFLYDAGQMEDKAARVSSANADDSIDAIEASMRKVSKSAELTPNIVGILDEDTMELSDSGRWVTLSGQDYTQFLIAKQWPPTASGHARRVPVGLRLDMLINDILREVDPSGNLQVAVDGISIKDLPEVKPGSPAGHGRGVPIEQNTSYWDVIFKTCARYGLICYVRGFDVVIGRPKNINDYPTHEIKQMAWGKNVSHLTLSRKLGKERVPRIVVIAYDEDGDFIHRVEEPPSGSKLDAKYKVHPSMRTRTTEKIKAATARPTGKTPKASKTKTIKREDEYEIVTVYGISDLKALERAAKTLRALRGRGERTIVTKTRDLVDIEGRPLLNLQAGDAVEVWWQDFNQQTMENPDLTPGEKADYLVENGFAEDVARALALQYAKMFGKKNRPLRLREATYQYDANSGIEIEMELVDFVVENAEREKSETPVQSFERVMGELGVDSWSIQ